MRFVRTSLLVTLAACLVGMPAHGASSASRTDVENDVVNPLVGSQLPAPLRYSQPPADILRWSIQADGTTITASVTMKGLLRDYYEQLAWATVPGVLVLFESPTLDNCVGCALPARNDARIALYYRTDPCGALSSSTSSLVQFEPAAGRPVSEIAIDVPFALSDNGATVTWRLPYTFANNVVLQRGKSLTNVSVLSFTETMQGVNGGASFCVMANVFEGAVDWSPDPSWDATSREVVPTGISITG